VKFQVQDLKFSLWVSDPRDVTCSLTHVTTRLVHRTFRTMTLHQRPLRSTRDSQLKTLKINTRLIILQYLRFSFYPTSYICISQPVSNKTVLSVTAGAVLWCRNNPFSDWWLSFPFPYIIIIFLHGLGRLTCFGIDALPSFPGGVYGLFFLEVCGWGRVSGVMVLSILSRWLIQLL
jgi:hypothetical protein